MSKLVSQTLLSDIPNLYDTTGEINPLCCVKLFTPDANWTWYIIEFSKDDTNTCYGYVQGLESELGYFRLEELEEVHGSLGLAIERDLSFIPTPFASIKVFNMSAFKNNKINSLTRDLSNEGRVEFFYNARYYEIFESVNGGYVVNLYSNGNRDSDGYYLDEHIVDG